MTPQTDRRHRPTSSRIQEWVTYTTLAGIAAILIQIGEFKANFKNLCEKVINLELIHSTYAAENKLEHQKISDKLADTREKIARQADRRMVER